MQTDLIMALENEISKIRLSKNSRLGLSLKKPVMLLLLVSMIENKRVNENRFHFNDMEKDLKAAIELFGGRSVKSGANPEQPFFHLSSHSAQLIWNLNFPVGLQPETYGKTAKISVLRTKQVFGYMDDSVFEKLYSSRYARARLVNFILENWWAPSLHQEIKDYLNLPDFSIEVSADVKNFAREVVKNYREQCAVCGFAASLNGRAFGLDAAHIKWRAYKGPNSLENGLALCKLHHWAFDRGTFTISPDSLKIQLSSEFLAKDQISIQGFDKFDGKIIKNWKDTAPSPEYLEWHKKECVCRVSRVKR